MADELEAVLVCPRCQDTQFKVYRRLYAGREDHGYYVLEAVRDGLTDANRTQCKVCGTNLERRPA